MTSTDATTRIRTAKHSEPTSFASSTVAYNKQILPLTINGDTRLLAKCEALYEIVTGDVFQQSVNNLGPTLIPYVPVGISTPTPSPLDRQMAGMTTAITAGPSDATAGQKRPRSEDNNKPAPKRSRRDEREEISVRAKAVMLAARKLDESVKKLDQAEEYRRKAEEVEAEAAKLKGEAEALLLQ